jgi:hypothetical protein
MSEFAFRKAIACLLTAAGASAVSAAPPASISGGAAYWASLATDARRAGGFWTPVSVDWSPSDGATVLMATHVCPAQLGGRDWTSSAVVPGRGIGLFPVVSWCGTDSHGAMTPAYRQGVHFYGGMIERGPVEPPRGVLAGEDIVAEAPPWQFDEAARMFANGKASYGGIVFVGDRKGIPDSVDENNGQVLLRHSLPGNLGRGSLTYGLADQEYLGKISGLVPAIFGGSDENVKLTILPLP